MTPNLKILKIKFCSVPDIFTRTEDKYWEEWFGFSRTIQALSQCRRIRKLHINAYQFWDDRTRDQLVQEFWNVTNDVLTSISYMDPSYSMENMIANMPVFSRVRELAVGCIDDMPLSKLCTLLTKHFPVLNKLIIDGQHQTFTNVQPVVDVATIVPLETPLDTLIYQDCRRGPKWISAIPTRQIHFLINTECYFSFLHYLFEALQLRKGIFGRHIVRKMLIEVERPSWGKTFEDAQREHLQYFNTQTLIPTENPEETLLESIRKVCLDQGVYFTTQITECDSSMGYIYGLMQYFGSR
ncbi:hypothetical protein FRC14_001143 [Serendipita sp. 396]|nr:hypothetical protein FRC14_001143 [Serendipita sp. 396]